METALQSEQKTTTVDAITLHHHYSGSMVTAGVRLSDVLSDGNLEVVEMRDVTIRSGGARSSELRCEELFLRKIDLLMVIPTGRHEAPTRRRNNYQKKDRFGAVIVMPGLIVSGIIHLPSRATVRMLFDDSGLSRFVGLTEVTVHSSTFGLTPSQCPTAIIRRWNIESVQLTARPLPERV